MNKDENNQVFNHSLVIARKVLPFMGKKIVPATPENYMIFYLSFEGDSEMVKRVVD
ncbi:MAG: hypothetical protein JRJ59_05115 [Deltaproteobacteria bacterium]|nr:hypothetical protein [Deltaproteobacteria bacterium]